MGLPLHMFLSFCFQFTLYALHIRCLKYGLDSLVLAVWCLDCLMYLTDISFYPPEDFLLQLFGWGNVFCAFRTKSVFFFYASYPKSWILSVVLFSCNSHWHLLTVLSLSLFNWSIFFTFSSSSDSLPSAWVPLLLRLSTELIYLTHVFQVLTLKMVHAEHACLFIEFLSPLLCYCPYFIPVCRLDQQLLSVRIASTNLDVLCFLSTRFLGFFDYSFYFSGILPNSFSLDAISVGFIKLLEELCYLFCVCFFCYPFGIYTTGVNSFAWFMLLLTLSSQLT